MKLIKNSDLCLQNEATLNLFIMHLLQNSPDNRGMITLCDIRLLRTALARMLSGDAFSSDI